MQQPERPHACLWLFSTGLCQTWACLYDCVTLTGSKICTDQCFEHLQQLDIAQEPRNALVACLPCVVYTAYSVQCKQWYLATLTGTHQQKLGTNGKSCVGSNCLRGSAYMEMGMPMALSTMPE